MKLFPSASPNIEFLNSDGGEADFSTELSYEAALLAFLRKNFPIDAAEKAGITFWPKFDSIFPLIS